MSESSTFLCFSIFGDSGGYDISTTSEEIFHLLFVTSIGQVSDEAGGGFSSGYGGSILLLKWLLFIFIGGIIYS